MRKINTTEFINISLHVAGIFTLAMEINTLATRAESMHILCKTDFNNCGVATIMALISLSPKALLFILKEKGSHGVAKSGACIFAIARLTYSARCLCYPPAPTFLLSCLTPQVLLPCRPVGIAWLHLHSMLQDLWAQCCHLPVPHALCSL